MLNGVWRIKWYRYRYLMAAALLINILLINFFFLSTPLIGLDTFRRPLPVVESELKPDPPPHTPPPSNPQPTSTPPTVAASSSTPLPLLPSLEVSKTPAPVETVPPTTPTSSAAALPPSSPSSSPSLTFNLHDYDFNGEYIGWPLKRACDESKFTPGLTFVCDNNTGGIGNIRNFILTCIRYGIEAGASQLILPRIQRRSEQELGELFTTSFQPFDYFFDKEHFLYAMGTYCPQMKVVETLDEIPNASNLLKIEEFDPKDLNIDRDGCDARGVNRHLDQFRNKFDNWLSTTRRKPTAEEPISIRFRWAIFFEWPVYRDGPEFAATFGDILRVRKDIQDLASKVLSEMSKFAGIEPHPPKLDAPFLGVHLRTETDSLDFWPNFDEQTKGYLEQAELRKLQYAYLACGDEKEATRFAEKALSETSPVHVTTKMQLLHDEDLIYLKTLTWDQQALVDYLVLLKSTHMTGCSFSSFTMNIGMKRHTLTEGLNSRQWKSPGDAYTTLIGRFESWYGDWMFMYECMWP
jgi:hypothetical protein